MNRYIKRLVLPVIAIASAITGADARNINVHGVVTSKHSGELLEGVCVYNAKNNKLLGSTNAEGKYLVSVDDAATLDPTLTRRKKLIKFSEF